MKKSNLAICIFLCAGMSSAVHENFNALFIDELAEIKSNVCTHDSEACRAINNVALHEHWITPTQPLGPFYPIRLPEEVDTDLTHVGEQPRALGTPVYVQGQVQNRDGEVIQNALIEIWQACESGRYNHPRDTNEAPIDPNFQYYAQTTSDNNGEYIFHTILPGAYPADVDWIRPPHIHFKITASGYAPLVTQLYFDPASFPALNLEELNSNDRILRQLSPIDRAKLIVSFRESAELNGDMLGSFVIYLKKVSG